MAVNFELLGAVGTVQLVGGTRTQPVRQVSARAVPSGATFTTIVVAADYNPSNLSLILDTIADAINRAMEEPGVSDVNLYQDVNNQGQFVNKVDVEVQSSSGNSEEQISVPYGALFDARFAARVAAAVANMDAIEAL